MDNIQYRQFVTFKIKESKLMKSTFDADFFDDKVNKIRATTTHSGPPVITTRLSLSINYLIPRKYSTF